MKTEKSRVIPQKLAENLELLIAKHRLCFVKLQCHVAKLLIYQLH